MRADDELAAVAAVEAYVLEERNAGAWEPLFGLVLHTLFELEVASDVAITGEGGRAVGRPIRLGIDERWGVEQRRLGSCWDAVAAAVAATPPPLPLTHALQ